MVRMEHELRPIFDPASVAVVGASEREGSLGRVVMQNIIEGGFSGPLFAVNPRYDQVMGVPCFAAVSQLPQPVDLIVVVTPASAVPGVIEDAGAYGVPGGVVLSAGFSEMGEVGRGLEAAMLTNARRHGLRLIGPNCVGIIRPRARLNATFSFQGAAAGRLALLSQSGAVCTAILDWAPAHSVGFSSVVSMGIAADIGFGEALDFLASDSHTDAILLYIEGIRDAQSFMSGLRAAARAKPVVVVKAGRHSGGAKAAASHTGSIVGTDDVFDAALRRAGVVRVLELDQLFSVATILSSQHVVEGGRLGMVTNAGGPGVLAADRAADVDIPLAELSPSTIAVLDAALPPHWSRGNPVDVLGDAPPERYEAAIQLVAADEGVDGLLVMFTPQAITPPERIAEQLAAMAPGIEKPLLACWLGETQVAPAREILRQAGIPQFNTPEAAVEAFAAVASYRRNQELLRQTPGPISGIPRRDLPLARSIIAGALAAGREELRSVEARDLMAAYGIPVVRAVSARDAAEAVAAAEAAGFPVAMKINSADISHKTDVGGVRLSLANAEEVAAEFDAMLTRVATNAPTARLDGVTVEAMHTVIHGRELLAGAMRDVAFGAAVVFGSGGTLVEVLRDRAIALPPLNEVIVQDLVDRTRAAKLLGPLRGNPPADRAAVEAVLLAVSQLVCDLPEVMELDINPLVASERGVMAVDARVSISPPPEGAGRYSHLAIEPYPEDLESHEQLSDGTAVEIRAIRPEDADAEQDFVRRLSPRSRTFRFRNALQELSSEMLVRFTQIDYRREMALVAVLEDGSQVGVARYVVAPDQRSAEFAIVISDELQGKGLGTLMLRRLSDVARLRGLTRIFGEVQQQNITMLELARDLGFVVGPVAGDPAIVRVEKRLD